MAGDLIAVVATDTQNDLLCLLEKCGPPDVQYAVILSTLIGLSKALGDDLRQLQADVAANWPRVPAPQVVQEH